MARQGLALANFIRDDALMTDSTISTEQIPDGNPGFWSWLMRILFGGPSAAGSYSSEQSTDETGEPATYVIAPGGYRIRVPQPDDVHRSIGEMLPSVRQGLALIPPLPRAVTELMKEVQDPKATAASVAGIAASDPSLAASLLRTVNSAAFGLHRKITSVTEAVSYLGFSSVKSLVVRLHLDQTLGGKAKSNDDVEDLWTHSLVVSYIADTLAKRVAGVDRGFVSTLGLLHDIGKLVVHTQFPNEAKELRSSRQESGEEGLLARERRILGVDHAELGATLAQQWGLPGDLVKAIRWHHAPERAFEPGDPKPLHQAMSLLQIADQLAKYCYVYGDETEIDMVSDAAFDAVGFSRNLTDLLDDNVRAAASRAIFFADDGTSRSATAVRRFLRLNRGDAAIRLLEAAGVASGGASQITVNDQLCASLFDPTTGAKQFHGTGNDAAMKQLLKEILHGEAKLPLTPDSGMAASLVTRCLLANAANKPGEKVEAAMGVVDGQARIALRSSSLSFAGRFGENFNPQSAVRSLDSELANVLNLGWFDSIETSSDGSTIAFTAKRAA